MPNVKSAAKRVRQTVRRTERNRAVRALFRSSLKKANLAIEAGDVEAAEKLVRETLSVIGKTEKKGVIHANKAARQASRLMAKLNATRAKG